MNNRDKSCDSCKYCRHNYSWCNKREELIPGKEIKYIENDVEKTATCPWFEWD